MSNFKPYIKAFEEVEQEKRIDAEEKLKKFIKNLIKNKEYGAVK